MSNSIITKVKVLIHLFGDKNTTPYYISLVLESLRMFMSRSYLEIGLTGQIVKFL